MADNIIKLRIESGEYEQKLRRAADGLQRFGEEAHQVGKAIDLADKEQANYIRMIGQMETVNRSARGKINELSNAFVELSSQYRHLTDEEKNSPFGEALSSSIEQLKQRVQDGKRELEDINRELNATSNEGQETGGVMKQLADRFTVNIDAMKLFDIGLKAVNGALGVAKDAFFASDANIDEWGRTVEAAHSVYDGFLNALNTGDISGFLSNINDIIIAARKAYDELDTLGTLQTIQAGQISGQQTENERMRAMLRTGKGIRSLSNTGRFFDMTYGIKDGQNLSEIAIRAIEARLKSGTDKIVDLTRNEVKQANRSIDAFYEKLALNNGMSLAEFRQGTSSWSEFSKRIEEYNKYQEWQNKAASDFYAQGGRGLAASPGKNPYEYAKKWGVFDVDGEEFGKLVQLIQQRDAQARNAYGMQMQAYRAINTVDNRLTPSGGGGGGRTGGGTPAVTEVRELTGLIEIQEQKIKDLRTAWREAATKEGIEDYRRQVKIATMEYDELIGKTKTGGVSVVGGSVEFNPDIAGVEKKMNQVLESSRKGEKEKPREVNLSKEVGSIVSGISSIGSNLEQMGITLPEGMKDVLGGIQGVIGVLTTISTIVSAIEAISAADTLIPFARGGVVRAASGFVDGTAYSGDQIPALLNAGEVVLNRAQVGNLASQLQDSTRGSNGIARVSGEQIYIAMNAYLRRSGKGELVTWK